jgi:hypothetical protein
MKVRHMRDYTEKVWFLGTDAVEESDWGLMDRNVLARAWHPDQEWSPGNFYRMSPDDDLFEEQVGEFREAGYSRRFVEIVKEGHRRGYLWIYFHPDIETEDVSEVAEEKLTAAELRERHGGSVWDDHPDFDRESWQAEAAVNDTCLGYWDWVQSQLEQGVFSSVDE